MARNFASSAYASVPMTEITEVHDVARDVRFCGWNQIIRRLPQTWRWKAGPRQIRHGLKERYPLLQEQDLERANADQTASLSDLEAGKHDPEESSDRRPPAAASARPASIR